MAGLLLINRHDFGGARARRSATGREIRPARKHMSDEVASTDQLRDTFGCLGIEAQNAPEAVGTEIDEDGRGRVPAMDELTARRPTKLHRIARSTG